ncbi:MAG: 4-phosphoerythronate dehydrogenase [Rhodothermales bacterium]
MRIVADENIPLVEHFFGRYGEVVLRPGRAISSRDLRDADALLVRSATHVNDKILEGSPVRFIGSATIGTDHIEIENVEKRGIIFAHAPGSNADSVVEYVIAALLTISARKAVDLRGRTVGIIGCGSIGSRLAERLPAIGCRILLNDPPLAEQAEKAGRDHDFVRLQDLLASSDIVSIHVPLTVSGRHLTRHLVDGPRLRNLLPGAWLVNTSRGSVVDNDALRDNVGRLGAVVLDVWENEPEPDPRLVEKVDLATPHIAGYSYDGKVAGTRMLYEAFARFVGEDIDYAEDAAALAMPLIPPDPRMPEMDWLHQVVSRMYAISEDDRSMRHGGGASPAEHFTRLRREYPVRRTFSAYSLQRLHVPGRFLEGVERGLMVQTGSGPIAEGA